jgi:formate dehydrogenase subunit gamma
VKTDAAAPQAEPAGLIRRFTTAEHWIHRTTAAMMGVVLVTALFLYEPALAEMVGRRRLLVTVHEWTGITLPVPLAAGLASRAFRADLRRLSRLGPPDRGWVRAALRQRARQAGKFNAGQKLYASILAGAVLVMIWTGLIMWFTGLAPLTWRIEATFLHDWIALLIGVLVLGHIRMAVRDPEARRGLRTGQVSRAWARRHHPLWEKEHPAPGEPQED